MKREIATYVAIFYGASLTLILGGSLSCHICGNINLTKTSCYKNFLLFLNTYAILQS